MNDYLLADDLSGALDAAAAFHDAGRAVRIVLDARRWEQRPDDDVVAVTTETRNAAPEEAAAIVREAIDTGRRLGARLVYKKIDSTLRGPVAAELQALADALPAARFLLAPANPAVGRTVEEGRLLVRGVPVAETEFSRDPAWPVRESRVAAYAAGLPPDRIDVPDTRTPVDLADAVARIARGGAWVAIGSGALARPVAGWLAAGSRVAAPAGEAVRGGVAPASGPVLCLAGSAHPANREQAAELAARTGGRVLELRVDAPEEFVREARLELGRRAVAIGVMETARRDHRRALAAASGAAAEIVTGAGVRRVFVTGGETAFALCGRLGLASLDFRGGIEPGLSLAAGETAGGPLWLAVKPGGFGDRLTWCRAKESLGAVS